MTTYHSYDPTQGHGLPDDPLRAVISPRPIAWISTLGADGKANLAPYSFFNIYSYTPPILIFGSLGEKDTLRNAIATGELVCNVVSRDMAPAMAQTAWAYPADIDEFEALGVAKIASDLVAAPRLRDAPVSVECRVIDHQRPRDKAGNVLDATIVMAQAERIHIRRDRLVNGIYDISKVGVVARCGYAGDYIETVSVFELLARDPATLPSIPGKISA